MAESLFVADGATLPGRVEREPGLYPEVTFQYRPATPAVRYEYVNLPAGDRLAGAARLICAQVRDLRVAGEAAGALIPEQAQRLHAGIFQALLDTVTGYRGPDLAALEGNSRVPSASG